MKVYFSNFDRNYFELLGERKQLNHDGEEFNNKEGDDQELNIADDDGEDEEENDEEMVLF